jgi:hypothetical protein
MLLFCAVAKISEYEMLLCVLNSKKLNQFVVMIYKKIQIMEQHEPQEQTDLTEQMKQMDLKTKKTIKKNLTAYWGISLNKELFDHPHIRSHLEAKTHLIPLERIHTTLLYVGKKEGNLDEAKYIPLEGRECTVKMKAVGCSDDALAMKVEHISYINEQNMEMDVPSHATTQHVTMALKKGIKPVESIKSFDTGLVELPDTIVVTGKITRFLY